MKTTYICTCVYIHIVFVFQKHIGWFRGIGPTGCLFPWVLQGAMREGLVFLNGEGRILVILGKGWSQETVGVAWFTRAVFYFWKAMEEPPPPPISHVTRPAKECRPRGFKPSGAEAVTVTAKTAQEANAGVCGGPRGPLGFQGLGRGPHGPLVP